jgi:hypothetical protein
MMFLPGILRQRERDKGDVGLALGFDPARHRRPAPRALRGAPVKVRPMASIGRVPPVRVPPRSHARRPELPEIKPAMPSIGWNILARLVFPNSRGSVAERPV